MSGRMGRINFIGDLRHSRILSFLLPFFTSPQASFVRQAALVPGACPPMTERWTTCKPRAKSQLVERYLARADREPQPRAAICKRYLGVRLPKLSSCFPFPDGAQATKQLTRTAVLLEHPQDDKMRVPRISRPKATSGYQVIRR